MNLLINKKKIKKLRNPPANPIVRLVKKSKILNILA